MKLFTFFKYFVLLIVGATTFLLFYSYPAPADRIVNIQNYFITVSGIISGIIIAYLAAKLFNIKQERENRQLLINKLSKKLTNFRRVLYCILKSHSFWVEYQELRRFKGEFAELTFQRMYQQTRQKDELKSKFYSNDKRDISDTTVDLFLAMEAIYGEGEFEAFGDWVYSPNIHFHYTPEELELMITPANQIWYFLEGRYGKHTEGLINDNGISPLYKKEVNEWIAQIDSKYQNIDFDRKLIARIATDFHTTTLPHLIELTEQNQAPMPKSFTNLFWNLVTIFVIGVIFPLFIQCLTLPCKWDIILTLSAVGVIVVAFVNLLFDFYTIMNKEVRPN